jgi:class 3 adenylate cyclase/antitoxin component YwqK of YwqJK toxin-antitoxin module
MRKYLYIVLVLLFFKELEAQEICRDTNCSIFKGAIEHQYLPKNYSGYYIRRYLKDYNSPTEMDSSIISDPSKLNPLGIIQPFKVKPEKDKFKLGQVTSISLLSKGKGVVTYLFHDNGKISSIGYSNFQPEKFKNRSYFGINLFINYYKNGNIESLSTFNIQDEQISLVLYYPDQTLRLKATTKKWKFEGSIVSFFPNGKVHKIGMTFNNKLEGYLLTYDMNGEFIRGDYYLKNIIQKNIDLKRHETQLVVLKLLAEEENRNIDRKNELIQATKDLVEKEVAKKQKEEELKIQESEIAKQKLELELLSKNKAITDLELREKQNEIAQAELLAKQKKQEIDNLSKENLIKELNIRNQEIELKKSDAEALINKSQIENLNKENKLKQLEAKQKQEELSKQKFIRNLFIGGFSLLILLVFFVFRSLQQNKKANKIITAQKAEVDKQKKLSDELLLNILPSEIAEELKEKGAAEAQLMENVTVLFTDFKGFTQLSEKLTPKKLVAEIHECFSAFDLIMQKRGVEKIKTIGDAYMAVGGLPISNNTHAYDVLLAALDIQKFMLELKKEKEEKGELFFEIRIGVHSGPVVAGIVGVKKFAYDIWGDTVNTASRMESSGEVGKVNISEITYELIKDRFQFSYRGKLNAKGKGDLDMYFVEGQL